MQCSCKWNAANQVLIVNNRVFVKGITKLLKTTFFPHRPLGHFKANANNLGVKNLFVSSAKAKLSQCDLGILLDEQLESLVNFKMAASSIDERCIDLIKVIRCVLSAQFWRPVHTQVPVGCKELKFGTKVDMICETMEGRLVILEIKCGSANYPEIKHTQTEHMNYPFQDIEASTRNLHFLQLFVTSWLFLHTQASLPQFAGMSVEAAYVLRLFRDAESNAVQYSLLALPPWLVVDPSRTREMIRVLKHAV